MRLPPVPTKAVMQKHAEPTSRSNLDRDLRLELFRMILRIRYVEERIVKLYPEGDMRCPTHFSIGQEACATGVCATLTRDDLVISAHRSHAHYIGKGGSLRAMFAELYGKADGCASGKGGSMHLIDLSVNFLGCVPIVGSTISIGVGASFGAMLQDKPPVTVVFFGDAAVETGVFHESVNFAAVHKLPVLFVCENNLYSVNTPLDARQPLNRTIADLARGHGIPASQHDGQDVEEVYRVTVDAMHAIRAGGGPALLEFMTYRWLEHCGPLPDQHLGYRGEDEFQAWKARCPLALHRQLLERDQVINEAGYARLVEEVSAEIDDAVAFARQSRFPDRSELLHHLYGKDRLSS